MKCVLYAATRNLYQDMVICMKSLLKHTKVDKIFCFIEDDHLPYPVPDFVECINVKDQGYLVKDGANYNTQFTYMTLLRPIAYKFIDIDKVLSLDCDTIVRKDISELFDIDLENQCFAAVKEGGTSLKTIHEYFNFGVALLNLEEIKKMDILLIKLLNECGFRWPEQDIMNLLCVDRIVPLPLKYNACHSINAGEFDDNNISIRHYAGWDKGDFKTSEEYGNYLMMPWEEILNERN